MLEKIIDELIEGKEAKNKFIVTQSTEKNMPMEEAVSVESVMNGRHESTVAEGKT